MDSPSAGRLRVPKLAAFTSGRDRLPMDGGKTTAKLGSKVSSSPHSLIPSPPTRSRRRGESLTTRGLLISVFTAGLTVGPAAGVTSPAAAQGDPVGGTGSHYFFSGAGNSW